MKVKIHIMGALICILVLNACSTSSTGIKQISSLQEGVQLPNTEGLLIGSLRWEQGGQGVAAHGNGRYRSPYTIVVLRNAASNQLYRHLLETPEFRLPLVPGDYTVEEVLGARLAVRVNSGSMGKAVPWLLNVVTLPLGMIVVPSEGINFRFKPALSPVVVTRGEATYIGALIIDMPDPLPNAPFMPHVRTEDEGVEALKEFEARFPGTTHIEKQLLVSER